MSERAAKNKTAAANTHLAILKRLRRVTAKHLPVNLGVAPRCRFRRKRRECVKASSLAQLGAMSIAREQIIERPRQRSAISWLHEQSGLLVLDNVAESAGIKGDDRGLAKERFDSREAEPFIDRRHDDGGRLSIKFRQRCLRDLSVPPHSRSESEIDSHADQVLTVWPIAHDVERC